MYSHTGEASGDILHLSVDPSMCSTLYTYTGHLLVTSRITCKDATRLVYNKYNQQNIQNLVSYVLTHR